MVEQFIEIERWAGKAKEPREGQPLSHMQLIQNAWEEISKVHQEGDPAKFLTTQQRHAELILGFWQGRLGQYFSKLRQGQDDPHVKYGSLEAGIKLNLDDPSERVTVKITDDIYSRGNKKMDIERWALLADNEDVAKKTYENTKVTLSSSRDRESDLLPSLSIVTNETDVVGWSSPDGYELELVNGNIRSFKCKKVIRDDSTRNIVNIEKNEVIEVSNWDRGF